MDRIKVIKTEQYYKEALKLAERLIARDPDPESAEGEQLVLLKIITMQQLQTAQKIKQTMAGGWDSSWCFWDT
jgi:antitoxin component HigA of HigAB toxin-antitoxin module